MGVVCRLNKTDAPRLAATIFNARPNDVTRILAVMDGPNLLMTITAYGLSQTFPSVHLPDAPSSILQFQSVAFLFC